MTSLQTKFSLTTIFSIVCPQQCHEIPWEVIFVSDFIHTFITLWHGDNDPRCNRSQLVPTEVKIGPTFVKQSMARVTPRNLSATFSRFKAHQLTVPRIHVEIALNVIKAWNLVQMKLLSCRSRNDLGACRKSLPFVCIAIWLLQTQV